MSQASVDTNTLPYAPKDIQYKQDCTNCAPKHTRMENLSSMQLVMHVHVHCVSVYIHVHVWLADVMFNNSFRNNHVLWWYYGYTNVLTWFNHLWDAQKENKATQHNRKTKQQYTTSPRVGFELMTVRLLGVRSYQLSYRGSSAGWARITYTIQSNQSTSTKASHSIAYSVYLSITYPVRKDLRALWTLRWAWSNRIWDGRKDKQ